MRTKLLGLAAAALTAGTLALGPTAAPAQAIGGLDSGNISGTGNLPTDVAVVATTPGDGIAAWVRPAPGGAVIQASRVDNGDWAPPMNVTPAAVTTAEDLQLIGNTKGDVVAVWTQFVDGEDAVRGARYLGGGQWGGAATLSPPGLTVLHSFDAAIDDAGQVQVATGIQDGPSTEVHLAIWLKGKAPAVALLSQQASGPSIAMTPGGDSVLAWAAAGSPSKVRVARRSVTGAWTAPDDVVWPDTVNGIDVGVADDGRATVAFYGFDDGYPRVVTSDISPTGEASAVDVVTPAGLSAGPFDFEVAPDGRATVSWVNWDNGTESLRMASRPAGGDFNGYSTVQSGMPAKPHSAVFARSTGSQVVVHDSGDKLTFRYRGNPAFTFSTYAAGTADGLFAADADSRGNVVAASVVDNGASSYVQADWLDVSGPSSSVTGPGAQVVSKAFDVTWSAADSLSGVKTSDVISSSAAWNSATFSDPKVVGDNLAAGPHHVSGGLGRTYCYEVQSIDKANNLGQRSTRKCTAVPLDDTALLGSGWSRTAKSGQFNGTWTTTSTKGRTLTRTGIKATRLALVANRVGNGGLVEVRWNGTLVRKISLKGTAATKKVLPIVTWGTVHTGTLKIKVISASGRPVRIDGLVVAK